MNSKLKEITIVSIIVIGALAWVYVAAEAYQMKNHHRLPWRYYITSHPRKPATLRDVSYVSSWMTFDYINKVFNLPPNYLENSLKIQNPKYPLITIDQYAETVKASDASLIAQTQDALKHYLTSSTTPQQ